MTVIPTTAGGASATLVAAAISRFRPASTDLLGARALLSRTDTKFVVPARRLGFLLAGLAGDYHILTQASGVAAGYRSVYLDTPDLRCFHDHRRGKLARHKIRFRHYLDRRLTYLEIKSRHGGEVTRKHRMEGRFGDETVGEAERRFLRRHCPLPADHLRPSLAVTFARLTLLGARIEERVTFDLDLAIETDDRSIGLAGVCIVEVKQRRLQRRTPIMLALRAHQLRGSPASKYCVGVALARPGARRNRLLPMLRTFEGARG